jgi:eukaryotic-like serine/threonine-protein kinase
MPALRFVLACLLVLGTAYGCANARSVTFTDLIGWWRTDLEYNGQRAEMYVRLAEEGGKSVAYVTLPPIHGWDFAIGDVKLEANRLVFAAIPMPLTVDSRGNTLDGELPRDLAPAQKIALRFRRAQAPAIPKPEPWTGPKPGVAWTYAADGPVWAGLEHDRASGLLIVAADTGTVVALDGQNGRPKWSFKAGGKVRARPLAANGSIYVNSDDGTLYKLEAASGRETWRAMIDSRTPREARAVFDRYGSSALVHGGRVFVGSADGNVYALSDASGREEWRASTKGKVYATPIAHQDAIVFGSFDGMLYSVNAADGKPRWQRDTRGAIATAPAVAGDRIIVGNRAFELTGSDAATGQEQWRQYLFFSWVDSVPTVVGNTVYVGSSDTSSVLAYDTRTGKREWISPLGGWCWAQPAVSGDRIYAGVAGGPTPLGPRRGAVVALARDSGRTLWAFDVATEGSSWGFPSSPVAAASGVYAADVSGQVYYLTDP